MRRQVFESRVVLDGSQTVFAACAPPCAFESRVVLDGSQTNCWSGAIDTLFESRVVLDGSQTLGSLWGTGSGLRVVLF